MSERIFIGRDTELGTLQEAWHRAKAGHPQMVVLWGETGLGKTRVVQEFYGWLSETNVEDPRRHWPDTLQIGRSLELSPPAGNVDLKGESAGYGRESASTWTINQDWPSQIRSF